MRISTLLVLLLFAAGQAFADESKTEQLRDKLSKHFPISSIEYLPEIKLYQAELPDGTIIFSDESGERFIVGSLYGFEDGVPVNLTERAKDEVRIKAVAQLDDKDLVIFKAKGQEIGSMYVFTDVDCGYCRRLHSEMDIYINNGVTVKYVAWPRCGINCVSYEKTVSVWCAEDQQEAMNIAKAGEVPEPKVCTNPVKEQYQLGVKMGIRGTPFIVLSTGQTIPGYKPASEIVEIFKKS